MEKFLPHLEDINVDLALALSIIWAGFIFGASSISGQDLPSVDVSDKLIHFMVYAIFGALLMWWRTNQHKGKIGGAMWQAVFLGSLYGITDEFHQAFVKGRSPDPSDWVADSVGVFCGVLVFVIFLNIYFKTRSSHGRGI